MGYYLIKNCDVANFDTLRCTRKDILLKNDRIETIAESIPVPEGPVTIIDANGKMAIPAFVDAHTHMPQTFMKGYMDDYTITQWLVRMFTASALMDEETYYYSALVGCMSSLRFGTTTVNEMSDYNRIDAVAQAMIDSGIRATIGAGHTDIAENEKTPVLSVDTCIEQSQSLYNRYHGKNNGMLFTSVAPAGLPACSKELMQALKQFAKEHGIVFHTHLAEGKKETNDVRNRTGWWEAETLYNYGILDENTLLAHSIWLQDEELELIKKAGANPVHCPNTNMKISDGIPKIQQMLNLSINVCMGCDGEASSSTRDMVREARAGAYLQKGITLNPQAMNLTQSYNMMTIHGAKALGHEKLGKLEEGWKADFSLVDMSGDIALTNRTTRLSNLLYAGTGHAVDTVFSNGEMVVCGGKNMRVNTEKVLNKSEELLEKLDWKIAALG